MTVSNEVISEMLAGLEGVTPGPWDVKTQEEWDAGFNFFGGPNGAFTFPIDGEPLDVAHIARCDPDTMRSILTELLERRTSQPVAWRYQTAECSADCWHYSSFDLTGESTAINVTPLYASPPAQGEPVAVKAAVAERDEARRLLAEATVALEYAEKGMKYAEKGLNMVHDGLMDPTRPRQSVGEVCAHFLEAARTTLSNIRGHNG